MAMVPWGDLLRSLRRRSKDSTIPLPPRQQNQPPQPQASSQPRSQGLPSWTTHSHHSPATSTMSPGTMSRAFILCTDLRSAR